ncbi:1-acyl-sn-glycerol-3-phosphate acyltransferase [Spirulina subsalsa FACHB-351]|uniref:1-acyl-sn-glycerol-3-phosphate acyltransferase n=2 Tax=Spirulina subsalsa TaxID=54311 RepID=A0ABT3L673_9CYAN|nr:1-acyl-sn-glycerol-3-phosphate acyltransferase [Spirulina subsalsa FACHB-351]
MHVLTPLPVPFPHPRTKTAVSHSRVSPWLSRLAYTLGQSLVLPAHFDQIHITGQENLPRTGPVLLAPTHRSRWDAIMVAYATGRPVTGRNMRFMVSINEMKGLQGWLISRLGGFPVNPLQLRLETIQHSVELLCEQEMLVIFPEGNIFRQRHVEPLKRGVATIALQAQSKLTAQAPEVQVIPIDISYSDLSAPRGCQVKIAIGQPLNTLDYQKYSPKQASRQLTADLQQALEELATPKTLKGDRLSEPEPILVA